MRCSLLIMATTEEIFHDAVALPHDVRAELTERLIASQPEDISPDITRARLVEVPRRITQVESGEAALIPGDEALARAKSAGVAAAIELAHHTIAPFPS